MRRAEVAEHEERGGADADGIDCRVEADDLAGLCASCWLLQLEDIGIALAMEGVAITVGEGLLGWTPDSYTGESVSDCSAFGLPVKVRALIDEYGDGFGTIGIFWISAYSVCVYDSSELQWQW